MRASAEDREGQATDHVGRRVRQGRLARGPLPPRVLATRGGRPRLRRSIERFPASDGTLYLLQGGHRDALALPDLPDRQRALLAGLDGSRTLDGLAELHPELTADEVTGTLDQLGELGLIEDAGADSDWLDDGERDRYDRQLEYFGELAAGSVSRAACQARLREARVVVIGLGGLGAWALWALGGRGRSGGSSAWTATSSSAATSTARRSIARRTSAGPRPWPRPARSRRSTPAISFEAIPRRLEGPDDVAAVVAGADFVVEAADWPPYRLSRWINSCCADAGVPHVGRQPVPAADSRGTDVRAGRARLPRLSRGVGAGARPTVRRAGRLAPAGRHVRGDLRAGVCADRRRAQQRRDPPHHGPGRAVDARGLAGDRHPDARAAPGGGRSCAWLR